MHNLVLAKWNRKQKEIFWQTEFTLFVIWKPNPLFSLFLFFMVAQIYLFEFFFSKHHVSVCIIYISSSIIVGFLVFLVNWVREEVAYSTTVSLSSFFFIKQSIVCAPYT